MQEYSVGSWNYYKHASGSHNRICADSIFVSNVGKRKYEDGAVPSFTKTILTPKIVESRYL